MRRPRISFIGGASMVWIPTFADELLSCGELEEGEVVLMDIDADRLATMEQYVLRLRRDRGSSMGVRATTDRDAALEGADFVVSTLMVAGHDAWATDLNIALKYGLQTPKGMSVGPGGLLLGLKAVPVIVELAQRVGELCPEAKLLNYTNPMSSITLGLQRYTPIPSAGICPGLDIELHKYAELLDVAVDELIPRAAGVNHCDFILELRRGGEDVLPQVVWELERTGEEPISRKIYDIFGALPIPGDIHIIEFFPYFIRKGVDLADWNQVHNHVERRIERRARTWSKVEVAARGEGSLVESSEKLEKLDRLVCSSWLDRSDVFQLNVMNRGAIPNVDANAVVELPVLADRFGYHAIQFGPLPTALAAICNAAAAVQDLTVQAAMTGDRKLALQALLLDPMVYSMDLATAGKMLDEMLMAQRDALPRFFA